MSANRPLEIRFWAATDTGRTRDHNEDNFLVDKKLNLFVVADGMGGHAAGEVASSVAVREVRRVVAENRERVEAYVKEDTPRGRQDMLDLLDEAVATACARVYEMSRESADRHGMGTTLSLMLVAGNRGFIGHVGDSRIYLTRMGQVHQLTEDHSLVNELIKRGRLKPGDEFESPYKNAVTRAVGVYETVEADTFDFDVLPGDGYLLCSDGLSCYLDDPITLDIMTREEIKEIPEAFIVLANEAGGKDNITAVVVRALPAAAEDQQRRVQDVRQKLDALRAIPLFKYLTYKGLVKVLNVTTTVTYEAGEVIFREDTRDDAFFVLLDGLVQLSRGGLPLADLSAGAHFGEMAMVDKAPRSATATALVAARALVIQRARFYELLRAEPVMAVKLTWSFIQVLNTRLRMTSRELLAARETIEVLRRNQAGGVVAEVPAFDPGLAAVGALPVAVTDELIPGFLLTEQESGGTDPLLRVEGQGPPEDADERPGLDRSAPATQPDRPSVMAFQRRTQPDLAVLRGRLADDAHDDEEAP
ncbi:MAG: Stp1/IreP family PP2C-type Ser/Thr phosphatase [Myxococcales bacterium]|nr:Stp1/IreP family PP2C-type Ser/Thr phosphatase [Myxococcales bacterium]